MNLNILIAVLILIMPFIFLGIFIYNRYQQLRETVFDSEKFTRFPRKKIFKLIKYYLIIIASLIVIQQLINWQMFLSNWEFELQGIIVLVIGSAMIIIDGYFNFAYIFCYEFLSYYYLNKYQKEYEFRNIPYEDPEETQK